MKDTHIHSSNFSYNSKSSIDEYVERAKKIGVDEITFTEHFDLFEGVNTDKKPLHLPLYKMNFNRIKDKYPIKINIGLEIGLQPSIKDKISHNIERLKFDYVIGSTHISDGKDVASDKSYFDDKSAYKALLQYYKDVLENVKTFDKEYDAYSSIDFALRYCDLLEKRVDYDEHKEVLDAILEELVRKDKALEVNTSGLKYGLVFPHPNPVIIRRYKDLGGKIITVGSGAHEANELAKNFEMAYDIVESVGFDEVAIYHERKPDFVKIKELRR